MYSPKSRKIRHLSSYNRWYGKSFSLFKHNWCKTTQSFLLPYLHRAWAIFESYSHLAPSFSCLERSLISIKGRRSDQVSNSYRDNFQQCTLTHTRLRSKHLRAIFDWEQFCVPVTLKHQDSQDQKKSTSNPDRLSNNHTGEDSIKTVQSEAFKNKRIYIENTQPRWWIQRTTRMASAMSNLGSSLSVTCSTPGFGMEAVYTAHRYWSLWLTQLFFCLSLLIQKSKALFGDMKWL